MEGAAKLIEFRGPDQLNRQEGLDIFTQLRAQIVRLVSLAFVKRRTLMLTIYYLEY